MQKRILLILALITLIILFLLAETIRKIYHHRLLSSEKEFLRHLRDRLVEADDYYRRHLSTLETPRAVLLIKRFIRQEQELIKNLDSILNLV